MTRYSPSPYYAHAGWAALGLCAISIWAATTWPPAWAAAAVFGLTAGALIALGRQPAVEVHDNYLRIGKRQMRWGEIRRVDRSWTSPLIVQLTLAGAQRVTVVFAGDVDSSHSLLRAIRYHAREALLDGAPWHKFWGEGRLSSPRPASPPRYHLLRPEDEAEVERLYQRLKSVRKLDPDSSADDK